MHSILSNTVEALICLPPLELMVQSEARSAAHEPWTSDGGLTYNSTEDTAVF